ncbi:hypothetical protein PAXRUDRAFT_166547 [Paxillus rubicundulus Ve08.2h10]|uniref:Uncharacterized protein n=1 Tax=Paxillus rubicundulus Ve08.2h10 TaxID=930991 RepID=A0A0D0D1T3_9AGAM|nr:hypothetical protein PAXRUDRAFT_166547 [Paxillus rubicundulus Ve08.2h10]
MCLICKKPHKNPNPTEAELECANSVAMDHNLQHHYSMVVEFSATIQILSSCSMSPNDIQCGCAALLQATQNWVQMGCHLTPYFHLVNYLEEQMHEFSLCYATWAFPYECHNGRLRKVNHNQHKGGELEGKMMQRWWSIMFNYELILHIKTVPDHTEDDEDSLRMLRDCLKAQKNDQHNVAQQDGEVGMYSICDLPVLLEQ